MTNERAVRILNELLEHECRGVLLRVRESNPFISWASADERRMIDDMLGEDTEHRARLVEVIRDLGGEPLPVTADIASTNMHFLDLGFVFPTLLEDRKRLLAAYESAASQVGAHAVAATVITEITDRHRRQIQRLAPLVGRIESTAT